MACCIAMLTRYAGEEGYTLLGNKNLVSYLFMSVLVATFMGMSMSAEEIIKERGLLKRERFLRLSRISYLTSKMIYLLFVSALQSGLFVAVGHTLLGIGSELFLRSWLVLGVTSFLANLTGLWLSQTLTSVVAIYITIPLLLIPQILLCGMVVRFDDLSREAAAHNRVPLVGNLVPSRWAFEALAVDFFRSNAYFAPIYPIEREKYLAQYDANIHAKQVRNLLSEAAWNQETRMDDLRTADWELTLMARRARVEPRRPTETDLACLSRVEKALRNRADNFVALLEKVQTKRAQQLGNDGLNQLKRQHHNQALEDLLLNTGSTEYYSETDHRIYPKLGTVYLHPESNWGGGPFLIGEKKWAGRIISTYAFDLSLLGCLVLLAILVIFAEFPSRWMRKSNQ